MKPVVPEFVRSKVSVFVELAKKSELLRRQAGLRESGPERVVETRVRPGVAVAGDGQLLRTALANLLENAWKFTAREPSARIEFGMTTVAGEDRTPLSRPADAPPGAAPRRPDRGSPRAPGRSRRPPAGAAGS